MSIETPPSAPEVDHAAKIESIGDQLRKNLESREFYAEKVLSLGRQFLHPDRAINDPAEMAGYANGMRREQIDGNGNTAYDIKWRNNEESRQEFEESIATWRHLVTLRNELESQQNSHM